MAKMLFRPYQGQKHQNKGPLMYTTVRQTIKISRCVDRNGFELAAFDNFAVVKSSFLSHFQILIKQSLCFETELYVTLNNYGTLIDRFLLS